MIWRLMGRGERDKVVWSCQEYKEVWTCQFSSHVHGFGLVAIFHWLNKSAHYFGFVAICHWLSHYWFVKSLTKGSYKKWTNMRQCLILRYPLPPRRMRHMMSEFFISCMISWDHDQDFKTNLFFPHCKVHQHLEKLPDIWIRDKYASMWNMLIPRDQRPNPPL